MPDGRAALHVENARLRNALARAERERDRAMASPPAPRTRRGPGTLGVWRRTMIYVVAGTCGQYSDKNWWIVRAFPTQAAADAFVDRLGAECTRASEHRTLNDLYSVIAPCEDCRAGVCALRFCPSDPAQRSTDEEDSCWTYYSPPAYSVYPLTLEGMP